MSSKLIWLENPNFIQQMRFEDKYYLQTLLKTLHSYLKKVPVHVISTWNWKSQSIDFIVGNNKKSFRISNTISAYDYIVLVDQWLVTFFPQFKKEIKIKRKLTEEEIFQGLNTGEFKNAAEAFKSTKEDIQLQFGIIERVYLLEDEFKLTIDGNSEIRKSGSISNPLIVSRFLKEIREIEDQNEISDYIYANSTFIKKLYFKDTVTISYFGKKLINFHKIHRDYLAANEVYPMENNTYRIGKFIITYESESHHQDCMEGIASLNLLY